MPQEQVIDKIKKLLELANSSNEHEARLASDRARELMEKFCITNLNQAEERIQEFVYSLKIARPPKGLVENLPFFIFDLSALFDGFGYSVSGQPRITAYPTNYKIIEHAVDCIINQLMIDFKTEFRKNPSIGFSIGFWKGAGAGISSKFGKKDKSEYGLVLYDAAKAHVFSKYAFDGHVRRTDSALGFSSGQSAALNSNIRQGVSASFGGNLLK